MNKIMLIGNVGREPDVRYFDKDQPIVHKSLTEQSGIISCYIVD